MAKVLRSACQEHECVEVHDDHFEQNASDEKWLRRVGQQGWVVLTKDAAIRTNFVEREALLSAKVASFSLGRGDLTAHEMGRIFAEALPQVRRVLRRFDVPVIASVARSSVVRVLYTAGERLPRPIDVRPRKAR